MRRGAASALMLVALLLAGCGGSNGSTGTSESTNASESTRASDSTQRVATRPEPKLVTPAGPPPGDLVVRDLIEGRGPAAARGDELTVEYIGIYYDGSHFTNSWKRAKPFEFTLGEGSTFVNPGWEKGIPGMKLGGRRELIIPPKLLYASGPPPGVTSADTLIYVIDLVAIGKPQGNT